MKHFFFTPKQAIYDVLIQYFARATLAEGRLRSSDQNITCLFVGDSGFRKYVFDLIYEDPPRILESRVIPLRNLKKIILAKNPEIAIVEIPAKYEPDLRGSYTYRSTKNVHQVLDLSEDWETLWRKFSSNNQQTTRKIRKHGLSFEITKEKANFDLFYYRMFLPHVRGRFRDGAHIDTYATLKKHFDKGFLLMVRDASGPIASGLCTEEDGRVLFRRMGVLNGDVEYLKKGAQAALYYFLIRHAQEKGFEKVDFLKSWSFARDGVYRHKCGWGAVTYPDLETSDCLLYFFRKKNPKIAQFLEANPVLVHSEAGLDVLLGWNSDLEAFEKRKDEILKQYAAPGIGNVLLYTPFTEETVRFACE